VSGRQPTTRSRYDVSFTGQVQGVGFRFAACRVAERFDVAGWVRNEPDGSVRCVVEGEPGELDAFVAAVQERMSGYVKDTQVRETPAAGDLQGFGVRT
jgi:acylphosphatase